jgi:hypothetical protein
MKKIILILSICLSLLSCEQYVTEISDLTLSGEYRVTQVQVINSYGGPSIQIYSNGQTYTSNSLPHPFNNIVTNQFRIHFTYADVYMSKEVNLGNGTWDWEYGYNKLYSNGGIFYRRIPYSYDAYTLGKFDFKYIPKNELSERRIIFNVISDLPESLQLSGLEHAPQGQNGPHYTLILKLERLGP